jgi:polyisoprenoid-binding protein YceI
MLLSGKSKDKPMRAFALLLLFASPALAAPADYVLEPEASTVGFETDFGQKQITGRMPVAQADLTLDFDAVANSKVMVVLDVAHASASFPFAADAMKGATVLDAKTYPTIRFESTSVKAAGNGAKVKGQLTIRGVTQTVTMNARIFRQDGRAKGDLSHLTIQLTGAVNRSAFGAVGWSDMVGDEVRLDIVARIARVNEAGSTDQ